MTTIQKLLERKQKLLERLQANPKADPTHTFSKVSMMLSQSGLSTRVGLVRCRAPRLFLVLFTAV
jgi:hypothetical protein